MGRDFGEALECYIEIVRRVLQFQRSDVQAQRSRLTLRSGKLVGRILIVENRQSASVGKGLRQQLHLLSGQFCLQKDDPGDVATRPRQALYIAACDRIVVCG